MGLAFPSRCSLRRDSPRLVVVFSISMGPPGGGLDAWTLYTPAPGGGGGHSGSERQNLGEVNPFEGKKGGQSASN